MLQFAFVFAVVQARVKNQKCEAVKAYWFAASCCATFNKFV